MGRRGPARIENESLRLCLKGVDNKTREREADNKNVRNLPQIAVSWLTTKVRLWEGDAKRKSEGAAAALGVGGRVKQEPSRLTLIYFRTPASGMASAGSAANWGSEGPASAQVGGRDAGDSWDGAVHALATVLEGWLTSLAGPVDGMEGGWWVCVCVCV
jgi:hypothetical protein